LRWEDPGNNSFIQIFQEILKRLNVLNHVKVVAKPPLY